MAYVVTDDEWVRIRVQVVAFPDHDLKGLFPGRCRANAQLRQHLADLERQLALGEAIERMMKEEAHRRGVKLRGSDV